MADQDDDNVNVNIPIDDDEDFDTLPAVNPDDICLVCKKEPIEFGAWPCKCPSMCRNCARKLCTGGKCRVCNEMFPEVKRLVRPSK